MEDIERIISAKNRVFHGGFGLGQNNPISLHIDTGHIYRVTGSSQIEYICGYKKWRYIMSEALSNLDDEYKQKKKEAIFKEEKQQIKQDYKEMKTLIKGADKLIQKHDEELKKFDKVWDKLDKEYKKLGETPTFEEVKEELNDNQQQFEEMKQDRNDYFTYKQGDIQFGDSQCDFCKYNDLNNKSVCIKYPNGKPNNVINTEVKCEFLEMEERI